MVVGQAGIAVSAWSAIRPAVGSSGDFSWKRSANALLLLLSCRTGPVFVPI